MKTFSLKLLIIKAMNLEKFIFAIFIVIVSIYDCRKNKSIDFIDKALFRGIRLLQYHNNNEGNLNKWKDQTATSNNGDLYDYQNNNKNSEDYSSNSISMSDNNENNTKSTSAELKKNQQNNYQSIYGKNYPPEIFNSVNFDKTKKCNYSERDPQCEICLPYNYFINSKNECVKCSSLIPNCVNCFIYGCEKCAPGYDLYITIDNSIPHCTKIKDQQKCIGYNIFETKYLDEIQICIQESLGINQIFSNLSISLIIIVVLSILGVVLIIMLTFYLYNKSMKKKKSKKKYSKHNVCSYCLCELPKDQLEISNSNENNNNEKVVKKMLNCGGHLCDGCEKIAETKLLTGDYNYCKICDIMVIWYISNDDDLLSILNSKNNIEENKNKNIIIEEEGDFKDAFPNNKNDEINKNFNSDNNTNENNNFKCEPHNVLQPKNKLKKNIDSAKSQSQKLNNSLNGEIDKNIQNEKEINKGVNSNSFQGENHLKIENKSNFIFRGILFN